MANSYQIRAAKRAAETLAKRGGLGNLWQAYDRPSQAKENAWNYCETLQAKYNGFGLEVITKNTCVFTAGFLFEDPETGVLKFMHITPSYDTIIDY